MTDVFIYDKNNKERQIIVQHIRKSVARFSEDDFFVKECKTLQDSKQYIVQENKLDLLLMELSNSVEIDFSAQVRTIYQEAEMMLFADATLSPMSYLTPKIRAAALLLKPFGQEEMERVVSDFISDYYRRKNAEEAKDKVFVINTKEGKERIPLAQVYYVEVREKRVYLRLRNKEYSQFGTLEGIMESLPHNFLRCHRSYAINVHFLEKVLLSENLIMLTHDITVPLSRSYKKEIKEYLNSVK